MDNSMRKRLKQWNNWISIWNKMNLYPYLTSCTKLTQNG